MGSEQDRTPGADQLGGDNSEGPRDEAENLPNRIARYSDARVRAVDMITHLQRHRQHPLLDGARQAMTTCGNYMLFHHYFTTGKVRLAAIRSCDKRLLCPLCAVLRGSKQVRAYSARLEVIRAAQPRLWPYMVTFTVKNGEDLEERYKHLHGSLQKLHNRRRLWIKGTRRAGWTESARADGAVWSYEVTNRGNGWHPHVHAIWLCETVPDQAMLRDEWQAITGDSHQVDVQPVTDPAAGFVEVFKYALKFSDLSLDDTVHAFLTLKGRRLVGSFGSFRGVEVPPENTDELLEDLPYVRLFYRYREGSGYNLEALSDPVDSTTDPYARA